jgi:hypothetical protein
MFSLWHESARSVLQRVFGAKAAELERFKQITYSPPTGGYALTVDGVSYELYDELHNERPAFQSGVQQARGLIEVYLGNIELFWPDEQAKATDQPSNDDDVVNVVVKICHRFDVAARRLRSRRTSRQPLVMNDEYDVQYLLGALLDIHFDDIQPEDYVPSFAGGSSRIDFVLRRERIAIEAKRTRQDLTAKKLGEELIIDIAKYNTHDGVDTLICFVYDPEHIIDNPRGVESDLEKTPSGRLKVRVCVRPL